MSFLLQLKHSSSTTMLCTAVLHHLVCDSSAEVKDWPGVCDRFKALGREEAQHDNAAAAPGQSSGRPGPVAQPRAR